MKNAKDYVYYCFLAVIAFQASRMVTSVDLLNEKMASAMTTLVHHEKRLDNLEKD